MNQNQEFPRFLTMTQTARLGFISLYTLRLMQKRGELPGFYAGSRFYVNLGKLLEQIGAC